jgi:hypothetical protein
MKVRTLALLIILALTSMRAVCAVLTNPGLTDGPVIRIVDVGPVLYGVRCRCQYYNPRKGCPIATGLAAQGVCCCSASDTSRSTVGDVRQLQLHGQESNVTTYNISRINMILHGVPVWDHKQGDSLRDPRHLTPENRIKQFDRIIMNSPFSLEVWGFDTVANGDRFRRLSYGMPPASSGDWAWLQQIAKSLKDVNPHTGLGGQGMVVMSQGVLFRGQPEQTEEEEDGQNQKADAEYVITDSPGDAHCTWSLDGRSLIFTSARMGFKDERALFTTTQPYGELFVGRVDGNRLRQLTDNQWEDGTPIWFSEP